MEKRIPDIVYHYCDTSAFYSIIQSSSLRMTNISKSNDYDEISYCFEAFHEALKESCRDFVNEYKENGLDLYFKDIRYDKLVSKAVRNNSLIYYVVCFSSEYDLLSQWCEYADNGKGVSIGFDTSQMIAANDYTHLKFNSICYDIMSDKQNLYYSIKDKLVEIKKKRGERTVFSEYENAINEFLSGMVYNAVFYKNPAFKEEKEWRLVFYPFGSIRNLIVPNMICETSTNKLFYDRMIECFEYEREYTGLNRKKIQFKCANDMLVSYTDINFNKIKRTFIKEIVIGPKSRVDDKDLRLFLLANGYDLSRINIRKSSASYR